MSLKLRVGLSLLLFAGVAANAARRPPGGNACPVYGQASVDIHQWYADGNRLSLSQIFGLDRRCDGMQVRDVSVLAAGHPQMRSQVYLLVNGYTEGYPQALRPNDLQWVSFRPAPGRDRLGQSIRMLENYFEGHTFVERVQITLGGDPQGPPPPPPPRDLVWTPSPNGGYYDASGVIQGNLRLAQMRPYGGRFQPGEPIPQQQVIVNSLGHVCAQAGYPYPTYGDCSRIPTHYE